MKDRAQAETDFRVNLKNEVGIERLQREIGAFRAETSKRLDAVERSARGERFDRVSRTSTPTSSNPSTTPSSG